MESTWSIVSAAFSDRDAFTEVRNEVEAEIGNGGNRLSQRQMELIRQAQIDAVPTLVGTAGGCGGIWLARTFRFFPRMHRAWAILPAIPCYIVPYQISYYFRDTVFLVEMMREDKSSNFAKRLRRTFEDHARPNSIVLDELDSGAEIEE
uniref:Uncharacterized protein n=1 Tax=Noctiluca scintillans TaxID=2966 RepID=A0A7S1FH49_NOCSC|mmetsp:Transcript_6064/g.16991  ORF Transcript_6064/g.16991 Transcript_6064/m.16991 type:complete len:149 (+) Transcript_6064:61-507(+)